MTPAQCRAARAWLELKQIELCADADVGQSTVKDFESGKRVPIPTTLAAMKAALEKRGIVFVDDGGETLGITVRR